jgi:polyisoprenoid-binding protein YceI
MDHGRRALSFGARRAAGADFLNKNSVTGCGISLLKERHPMNCCLFTIAVSMLLLGRASALAQASARALDKNHTQVDFQIRRVPVSNVRGSFGGITGTLIWDDKDPSKCRLEAVIPAASISTNNETRDKDFRSANFFDVEKYPTMTFKSTAVTGTPGKLQVTGNLTLAGITKTVTFSVDGQAAPARMGNRWSSVSPLREPSSGVISVLRPNTPL